MIKLQIVIPTLDQSGAEKQFGLLACGLPKDQFDVHVLALSRGGPYEALLAEHHVPYTILKKRWRFDPTPIRQLRRQIRLTQPDVLLSCLFSANTAVRLATAGLRKRPVTIISERCVDSWKSGWQLTVDRLLRSRTDRLVANSKSVAAFYQQQGFPAERTTVIPNGVEIPPPPGLTRAELLQQLGLPPEARLIAFVGRLAPQKGLRHLLWAAQLLRQADPNAYLLLIGDGPERSDLEQYARDVEVTSHLRLLGHRRDAASLLHLIDVFWLGSQFEGMSNSLMEAMACGRPVVVSDIPPNRELVQHGVEGWIVNPGDSVGFAQYTLRLLQEPELFTRMGQAGAQKMQAAYSVDRMVARYAELLANEVNRSAK
ncbi:glycosyltransferase [Planctomicrobium piriforme]|uniref:glycosyltransferase n=1 Tax=Planctomicrobium piriforme TaxID=1576369 RepID=UPI001FE7FF05|nr:glycosyltransferase [Planctomicrobium piriforme]